MPEDAVATPTVIDLYVHVFNPVNTSFNEVLVVDTVTLPLSVAPLSVVSNWLELVLHDGKELAGSWD